MKRTPRARLMRIKQALGAETWMIGIYRGSVRRIGRKWHSRAWHFRVWCTLDDHTLAQGRRDTLADAGAEVKWALRKAAGITEGSR